MQTMDIHELDWLAFRYIANEMTAIEADSFESRLADDQAAREAVARAVELAQAVACVPTSIILFQATHRALANTSRPYFGRRPLRWIAAAAAVVLGVVGVQVFKGSSENSKLAKVWAKIRIGSEVLDLSEHDLIAESEESLETSDELTVPGWMIEAVGGGSDEDKWEDS